jgi:hypothetical protein
MVVITFPMQKAYFKKKPWTYTLLWPDGPTHEQSWPTENAGTARQLGPGRKEGLVPGNTGPVQNATTVPGLILARHWNKQTDASASADYMWNGGLKVLRLVDVSPIKILEGFYIRSNGSWTCVLSPFLTNQQSTTWHTNATNLSSTQSTTLQILIRTQLFCSLACSSRKLFFMRIDLYHLYLREK